MNTTIDKAGRVVIPAGVREKAGFEPGSKLEIILDDLGVRLLRAAPRPRLARRGKLLVIKPARVAKAKSVDVAKLIEEERNRWP